MLDPIFVYTWRNKWLTAEAKTIDDMIDGLREASEHLQKMKEDGVVLDPDGGTSDDYAMLTTNDPEIAEKYDMEEIENEEDYSVDGVID